MSEIQYAAPVTEEVEDEELDSMLRTLDGILYGSLTARETALVDLAEARGLAERRYEGGAGILGLSTVRRIR